MRNSLQQHLSQLANDRWARQGVRTLLRAAILAASIWCIGLGGSLLWGWPFRIDILGALALATIGGGVLLLLRPRLSPQQAARRLDKRFHLDEQLATAIEVAATRPPPDSIASRLVAQSSSTAGLLRQRIAKRQRPPWNELLTLLALLPVALGLYILSGIGSLSPEDGVIPLPPLAAPRDPAEQFAEQPPPQEQSGAPGVGAPAPGAGPQTGAGDQRSAVGNPSTLEALADALRDQGATRPAAEALDRGDISGAAQQLRELADQASQLSQESRDDLAAALRDAAERIEPQDPSLADQLRRSADRLEQGGQEAAQALDELARAIENSQSPQSPSASGGQQSEQADQSAQGDQSGEGSGQSGQSGQGGDPGGAGRGSAGEQRPAAPPNRLGVAGQPVPLEADGPGAAPAEPSDRQPTTSEVVPGTTSGDSSSSERIETGADPLRVPLDERDVVQEYFQPQE